MRRYVLFIFCCIVSSVSFADVTMKEGEVVSVAMYEECLVMRLKNDPSVYVYPNTLASFNSKFSIALAALNSGKRVRVGYWGTGHCESVDSQPAGAPSGLKYYINIIEQLK
ncbi:hypothetical protein SAMN02745866_04221 [Alteromonadaceae bacterium Bs31]|nr:hypothetical protein SAMN02745866_04221 [Alteromonadaceae bacterium Bs31]